MNNREIMLRFKWTPENKTLEVPMGFGTIRVTGIETYEQMAREITRIIENDLLIPGLNHERGSIYELDV